MPSTLMLKSKSSIDRAHVLVTKVSMFDRFLSMAQTTTPTDDQINSDLMALFQVLLNSWRIVTIGTISVLFLSAIYAFVIAKPAFYSTALLIPTTQQSPDQLGAAAALLGKKALTGTDVELYQNLLKSRSVLNRLLLDSVTQSVDSHIVRHIAVFQLFEIDTTDKVAVENAIAMLEKKISITSKEVGSAGILEVGVEAKTPELAQEMCSRLLDIAQAELHRTRTRRYKVILDRLEYAVQQAKEEWDFDATQLATFRGSNRSIIQPNQILEQDRLEIEKSAKEQKYLLARREFETQQLELAKATPPMMTFDEPNLPAQKSKPKRKAILLIGLFGGLICSSTFALTKHSIKKA